jgi:hypothetical protein
MGPRQRSQVGWWSVVWLYLVWFLVACSNGAPQSAPVGAAQNGDRCQKSEDCASLICVRLTGDTGVCSVPCDTVENCPSSDNWGCLSSPTIESKVCACVLLSDTEVCGDGVDNDCNGKVDDCRICDGRAVPADDPAHCGDCDTACRADQRCERGVCKCPVTSGLECGNRCTNPDIDSNNCGECGVSCGSGRLCSDGGCTCPLATEPDYCPLSGCVTLDSDQNNCGKCGTSCTLGQTCRAGDCVCPSVVAPDFCDGTGCVDLQKDANHCGKCGNACVSTQACSAGKCSCPSGQELCGDVCVDTKSDARHCGACDSECPMALACVDGKCDCSAPGYAICGPDCAKLAQDPLNCGVCNNECAPGETCSGGLCSCASSLYCDDECMPVDDDQNCGSCGHACPAGQACQGGQCGCVGFGLTPCGDQCVSLTSDEQHCGTCQMQCKNTQQCSALGCSCPGSQAFCDNVNACVALSTDAQHCGACDKACNPTEICASSSCKCPVTGQKYCASQSACTDTLSNEAHCGACNKACRPTEQCNGGSCACPSGESFCDNANACVDLTSDSQHCGACGTVCPVGTHCAGSACACNVAGQTLCGSVCYDLKANPDHCGTCNNDCGGNYQCKAGACKCPQPVLGTEVRLTTTEDRSKPRVAFDGSHVAVLYTGYQMTVDNNLHFLLVNPDGTLVPNSDVDLQGPVWGEYDVTSNGSEFLVVAKNSNNGTILVRRIGANGVPKDKGVSFAAGVDDFLRVAWLPTYGGYSVVYDTASNVFARRIGTDGTSPEAAQGWGASSQTSNASNLAVAADGGLGVQLINNPQIYFARTSASGVPATPLPTFENNVAHAIPLYGAVGYDTSGFFSIWSRSKQIVVNRGDAPNGPALLTTIVENENIHAFTLAQDTASMAVAWSQGPGGTSAGDRFRFQRFTLPNAVSGTAAPITDAIDVVSAHAWYEVALVRTGPYKLLAVWADGRNGNDTVHDLYARSIDLQACP